MKFGLDSSGKLPKTSQSLLTFVNPKSKSVFSIEDIDRMIQAVEDVESRLTEWELGFITDLSDKFVSTRTLTEKQLIALEDIYAKRTD